MRRNAMEQKNFLRIKEAVSTYGFSESYFRHSIMSRKIPYIKCGRSILIDRNRFEEYLRSYSVEPGGNR